MPSSQTFSMGPVRDLLGRYIRPGMKVLDPFAGYSLVGTRTNDLNPATCAQDHMPADQWLDVVALEGVLYDIVLQDPPYSARQVMENYNGFGREVLQADTQQRFITVVRNKVAGLLKPDGISISFGWNTVGMGKKRGFRIVEILVLCHGRHHNDTLIVVERKVRDGADP